MKNKVIKEFIKELKKYKESDSTVGVWFSLETDLIYITGLIKTMTKNTFTIRMIRTEDLVVVPFLSIKGILIPSEKTIQFLKTENIFHNKPFSKGG